MKDMRAKVIYCRRVNKLWRKEVHGILTRYSLLAETLFTELFTLENSWNATPSYPSECKRRAKEIGIILIDAARLGFAGCRRITLPDQPRLNRAEKFLVKLAFDAAANHRRIHALNENDKLQAL